MEALSDDSTIFQIVRKVGKTKTTSFKYRPIQILSLACTLQTFCNKAIIKHPITFLKRRYTWVTTLWNAAVRKQERMSLPILLHIRLV